MSLPLVKPDVEPPEAQPPPSTANAVQRATLLIIDDEPAVARTLQRLLASVYDITTVNSGREALALLAGEARFDLILCDLMMPDVTGMDLHAELAQRGEPAHEPDDLHDGRRLHDARA